MTLHAPVSHRAHHTLHTLQVQRRNLARTRKRQLLGVAVLAVLLILQFFFNLLTTQSTLPSGATSDIIYGGVASKEELLLQYDDQTSDFHLLANTVGITRENIEQVTPKRTWPAETIPSGPLVIWSRSANYQPITSQYYASLSPSFVIKDPHTHHFFYGTPLNSSALFAIEKKPALLGKNSQGQPFAILQDSGNIIMGWEASKAHNFCYATPNTDSLLRCPKSNSFTTTLNVTTLQSKTDGHLLKIKPGNTLRYTLHYKNESDQTITLTPHIAIDDILEYAELIESSNASWNASTKTLSWHPITLTPQQSASNSFDIKIREQAPLTRQNSNNARSYDCRMSLYYGTLDSVAIVCPPAKVIERAVNQDVPYNTAVFGGWLLLIVQCLLVIRNDIVLRKLTKAIDTQRGEIAP